MLEVLELLGLASTCRQLKPINRLPRSLSSARVTRHIYRPSSPPPTPHPSTSHHQPRLEYLNQIMSALRLYKSDTSPTRSLEPCNGLPCDNEFERMRHLQLLRRKLAEPIGYPRNVRFVSVQTLSHSPSDRFSIVWARHSGIASMYYRNCAFHG